MEKKILIVDDADFMRLMLRQILEKESEFTLSEAVNGKQAIERFQTDSPDLILLDITMPEIDGLETLKEIKSMDPSVKVVMCSAMGQESIVIESIKSGAADFIVKPFKAAKVVETIKKVLNMS